MSRSLFRMCEKALEYTTMRFMSDDLPLVSIAIPAYNHAAYLGEAIESVLAQDYPHVELLVLDDGSTDNTREVLKKYTGRFTSGTGL